LIRDWLNKILGRTDEVDAGTKPLPNQVDSLAAAQAHGAYGGYATPEPDHDEMKADDPAP
jgi:hypothetical protein